MRLTLLLIAATTALSAWAQHLPFPDYAGDDARTLRVALRAGDAGVHFALGPYTYDDVDTLVRAARAAGFADSWRERDDLERLRARLGVAPLRTAPDRGGLRGWLGSTFYRRAGYAVSVDKPGLTLRVNPVLDVSAGEQSGSGGRGGVVVQNTRGLTLWADVDDRVSFQTTFYENQARLPSWAREWRAAYDDRVPGVGFYKDYDAILFDADDAVDYFQATGEVGVRLTDHIHFRLGHGNPRLGIGDRSLLLDDFADPYLYAQLDTRVWKLHYRNVYAQLQDGVQSTTRIARKFMVAHTVSVALTSSWEVGLTEQTVFARDGGFDAQYLNPIILYRAVEQDNGSPDNAMLGAHTNVRLGRSGVVYGQLLFDEFKFDELFGGDGWWGNKYAWQLGWRGFDVGGAVGLDLGVEYNRVRPFTYAHRFPSISYTHYSQPLAHPWGASLEELRVRASKQFSTRWRVRAVATLMQQGDIDAPPRPHGGANVLFNNNARARDYGYEVADAPAVTRLHLQTTLEYLPAHGATVFARYDLYDVNSDRVGGFSQHGVRVGVTLNAIRRSSLF